MDNNAQNEGGAPKKPDLETVEPIMDYDLQHARPAPDTFDVEYAEEAGKWLKRITSEQGNFFERFEQPNSKEPDFEFTERAFVRAVSQVLGEKDVERCFEAFLDAGLIRMVPGSEAGGLTTYRPACRINTVRLKQSSSEAQAFVCTDSPIVHQTARVFPWPDEGIELFEQITAHWTGKAPANILDLCSGAGTAGFLLKSHWPDAKITGLDNSSRALKYARFNARLNGYKDFIPFVFDLLQDGSLAEQFEGEAFDIVAVDPPFTPIPDRVKGYSHSSTRKVAAEALRAGAKLVRPGGLLVMLNYAFGIEKAAIPETLDATLSTIDEALFDTPVVSKVDGNVWRVEGEKQIPFNPMPVEYMATRYLDRDWIEQFRDAELTLGQYVKWIENEFVAKNLTHLHYVALILHRRE